MTQIDTKYSPPAPYSLLPTPYPCSLLPKNVLPSSKLQANCKQENRHTLTVCIFAQNQYKQFVKKTQKYIPNM